MIKQLMILLHGYGTNKNNLASMAYEFASTLPNCHFISLNAPFIYELATIKGQKDTYQWFSATKPRSLTLKEAEKSSNIFGDFIDFHLKRLNLSDKDLILTGFSQGAMMSIYHAIRRPDPIGAIIAIAAKRLKKSSRGPNTIDGRRITADAKALCNPASPAALLFA